jgi:nucleoside-diphosphate-sugar epimerase
VNSQTDPTTIATFAGRKVLVVGGAGFVGSNLVHALLECSPRSILVVDNLLSAERSNVPEHSTVSFVEGSITDPLLLETIDRHVEFIFHLATFHGNQNSIHDPLADHDNNTLTTLKLYQTIKDFPRLQKIVYASAGCTVAEKTPGSPRATKEDSPVSLHHDSPYQISKIIGELYSNYYWRHHGLPIVKARFQNVFGPREILGAGRWRGTAATVWRNVVPTFVYRAVKGMELTVENEGRPTRDFIYVHDIVRGLLLCASQGQAGQVYNLATGGETSILDLARAVNELAVNPHPIRFAPGRPWDRSIRRFGSTDKARRELGFVAKVGLSDGLSLTLDWTRKHLELIDGCIRRHERHLRSIS